MNKTGFGFLRLPRRQPDEENSVDEPLLNALADSFLLHGGNYFDTAYIYLGGASEEALRKCVVERYPRTAFRIADKLPGWEMTSHEQCFACFSEQLTRCGVTYFDVYLLHGLNEENYAICEKQDEFAFLRQIKAEGRARKIGFSYHDGPELLDRILTEHPETDYVQLQINYLDWDSAAIQSAKCYEIAVRHGKKVIVMEPVKGGSLATLPEQAETMLQTLRPGESPASWAIRFATNLDAVEIVLSGMNTMLQIEDNMRDFPPLNQEEYAALAGAAEIIRSRIAVSCTGCGYCLSHCPGHIPIPRYFALYNDYARNPEEGWKMENIYAGLAKKYAKASQCIGCGGCEKHCPQGLPVPTLLKDVAKAFEN